MIFSASRIKAWADCSLAAHYKYDLLFPERSNAKAVFGSCIHRAAERYNNTGSLPGAKKLFLSEWGSASPDYWPKQTDYAGLKAKGVEILEALDVHYRFQDRRVLGTEVPFLVPFGDHELHGYVDLVETQRSGTGREVLKIVDYKTASHSPTKLELALDLQFTTYHYAVTQREFWCGNPNSPEFVGVPNGEWLWETVVQAIPKRCVWFALWSGRQLDAGPRTEVDYRRLYRACTQIERAIQHEVFVPKIGEACNYCDFSEQCAMEIPVAVAALQDSNDETRWV